MTISTREVTSNVDGLSMVAYLARPDGQGSLAGGADRT